MAEEPIHDDPKLATLALLGTVGFLLLMFGGEAILMREPPLYLIGGILIVLGIGCFYLLIIAQWARGKSEWILVPIAKISADPKWWLAIILTSLWVLASSPFIEDRRWPFDLWRRLAATSANPASADDIANAVVSKLSSLSAQSGLMPKFPTADEIAQAVSRQIATHTQQIQPVPAVAPVPFVNPIHTDAAKWKIAKWLADWQRRPDSLKCRFTIVRLQQSYAEDYADDLKQILDVAKLPYDEIFASSTIEKGLSFRQITPVGDREASCGWTLSNALRIGAVRDNIDYPAGIEKAEAPEFLRNCPVAGCVEIDIGNERPN